MEKNQQHKKRESSTLDGSRLSRELIGLFSIFFGLLLMLSLASFDSRDPWLNHVVSKAPVIHNRAGLFGSYTAGLLLDLFGMYAAWFFPACFCLMGARRILAARAWPWWRWIGVTCLVAVVAFFGASSDAALISSGTPKAIATHGGGLLGHFLFDALVGWLSGTGAWLVWTLCLLLSIQMLVGFTWLGIVAGAWRMFWQSMLAMLAERRESRTLAREQAREQASQAAAQEKPLPVQRLPLNTPPSKAAQPVIAVPSTPVAPPTPAVSAWGEAASPFGSGLSLIDAPLSFDPPVVSGPGSAPVFTPDSPDACGDFDDADTEFSFAIEKGPVGNFSLFSKKGTADEPADDDPPWVRDFQQNHIGVTGNGALLTIPFVMPGTGPASSPPPLPPLPDSAAAATPPPSPWQGAEDAAPLSHTHGAEEPGRALHPLPDARGNEHEGFQPENIQPEGFQPEPASGHEQEISIRSEVPDSLARKSTEATTQPVVAVAKTRLPTVDLIEAMPLSTTTMTRELLEEMGRTLMNCLKDFGIMGELVAITPGPVITMFEVRPAPGIRVAKIANLSDELAMSLKAVAIRIQAPVPGTDIVGIEIPNPHRDTVGLRELFESDVFKQSKSLLTLALGKDIAGHPAVTDLAPLPHLLVAGATGAGKSVGINAIILSILFKARPDEVRFLLVDPKQVELAVYDGLPHLLHPVVTDMDQAKNALAWAVQEMERRYQLLKEVQVRNLGGYNAKLKELEASNPEQAKGMEPLPYIVVIVDEFSDLMLTAAKEVEGSIIRLSQLARAAGIHIILATQRPSVNVITGIIKANLPGRMAFRVASSHDSRTILDSIGAEKLLGRGDMLYKSGLAPQRLHGAYVSDETVLRVVEYWKKQKKAEYKIDFADWNESRNDEDVQGYGGSNDVSSDPLYNDVVLFVRDQGKTSISLIQRQFRIGFNKAARFVEQMEQDGIIGPQDGCKPRNVIR